MTFIYELSNVKAFESYRLTEIHTYRQTWPKLHTTPLRGWSKYKMKWDTKAKTSQKKNNSPVMLKTLKSSSTEGGRLFQAACAVAKFQPCSWLLVAEGCWQTEVHVWPALTAELNLYSRMHGTLNQNLSLWLNTVDCQTSEHHHHRWDSNDSPTDWFLLRFLTHMLRELCLKTGKKVRWCVIYSLSLLRPKL